MGTLARLRRPSETHGPWNQGNLLVRTASNQSPVMMRIQRGNQSLKPSHRRGATLILVVMLLFAILALAGLVIDLGLARAARRQMQSAVDAAALEGLRFSNPNEDQQNFPSDVVQQALDDPEVRQQLQSPPGSHYDPDAPEWKTWWSSTQPRSVLMRAAARQAAQANTPIVPQVTLTNGIPLADGFNASQDLDVTRDANGEVLAVPAIPNLRLNTDNMLSGDMYTGKFQEKDNDHPNVRHIENPQDYSRDDFDYDNSNPKSIEAFLVRARRTNETLPDDLNHSNGSPLPYLFARGSLLALKSNADGISFRATAIAAKECAKSIGPPVTEFRVPGCSPFAVSFTDWSNWGTNPTSNVFAAYWIVSQNGVCVAQNLTTITNVTPASKPSDLEVYVPIFASIDSADLIVGFGKIQGWTSVGTDTVSLTSTTDGVAPINATSAVVFNDVQLLTSAQILQVIAMNISLTDNGLPTPLMVPILRR